MNSVKLGRGDRMNILATSLAFCILIIATTCTSLGFVNKRANYDVIINSHPFGVPPAPKVSSSGKPQEVAPKEKPLSQSFARNLRLVGIRKSKRGIRVGFVDIKNKAGVSYLLYVGQGRDGINVVDASYEEEKALLEKDGEEHWIYMDGQTGIAGSTAQPASSKSSSRTSKSASSKAPATSHRSRLKSRLEAVRKRTVEPPPLTGENLAERNQNFAVDVIRKGEMPPPPVRLTRENDDTLVREGVLPPQE
jgi:hypothetical protein